VNLDECVREPTPLDPRTAPDATDLFAAEGDDGAATGLLDSLDRGNHAERPIEPAPLRDAVQMRPRPDPPRPSV
jgi:hypothetical protein